jgi:NAD(P)-dependent dehydrogenase (short-subunit alcohol dehydrogenase family)
VVVGDLERLDEVEALMEAATAPVGPIGLLVNSASIFVDDVAQALTPESLTRHLSINLAAPCLLVSAMVRRLPEGAHGLVVNMIDQRVLKPTPQFFSYSLSKAGLAWTTRTMAQAFAPRIRVVGLAPGPTVKSERQSDEDFRRQSEAVLLGRGPDLADFGRTIRWLVETPSVTGQIIALDGGQHLAWETADVVGVSE